METYTNQDLMELFSMKNKVVVVTGAKGGIGTAIANILHSMGAKLILTDIDDSIHEHAKQWNAHSVVLDVSDNEAIERIAHSLINQYDNIDGLVANAEVGENRPSLEITKEQWRNVMSVNLDGVFYTMQAFAKYMVNRESGSIVGISSISGFRSAKPTLSQISYSTSKAGVAHLCSMLAVDLGKTSVRVNSVSPGFTDTSLLKSSRESEGLDALLNRTPLGRLLKPEEIARTIAFLLSDASSGITGENIFVDGGYSKY